MAPDHPFWIRWLVRVAVRRSSEAEIGDVMEEYAGGARSGLWLVRQLASTFRDRRSHVAIRRRTASMVSNLSSDARYALRTLRRHPGFAVAAIAPIALGIGINTGVFSVLSNVVLQPLPTPEPTELVSVYQDFRGVRGRHVRGARSMFSMPEYRTYRDDARTLSGLTAYTVGWTVTLGTTSPQEIEGTLVTCSYFDVLQIRPAIGTGFTPANCGAPDAPPAVVLSHALWTRAFGGNADILRKTIALNGQDVVVVGVAPEGFEGIDLTRAAFFASTSLQREFQDDPQLSWLALIGRRQRGVGMAQVRAEFGVIAGRIDRQQPGRTTTLIIEPATALSLPVARQEFLGNAAIVLAAFGLVLLIACANVANVLLARVAGRTKEIAVRLSVGASRGRLIQQLLTESLLIALAGGVAGSLLAWWSFQGLLVWVLSRLPDTMSQPRMDAHPSLTALAFAIALSVATALLVGLIPALQASKQDMQMVMKRDDVESGGRTGWLRGVLIGSQVAVCMVLLVSAGLLLRALNAAQTTEPGFDYRNVAVVSSNVDGRAYDDARVVAFQQELQDRIGALPGVGGVARVGKVPLSPGQMQTAFRVQREDELQEVDFNTVPAEYFSLIGVPIVRGRTFTTPEMEGTSPAVIVTESTARRYWPGQDPVGRTILMGSTAPTTLEIVGVAKDAAVLHVGRTESSYMYLPAGPEAQRRLHLLVRSRGDFGALATSIRTVARELDPRLVVRVNRIEENLGYWQSGARAVASLSLSLALLALSLALVGVYGVVSYVVNRRRREVGIRMTLGATSRDVRRLIVGQTLRPVVIGVVIGIAGATAASQLLESLLFGVSPFDPVAFIGAALFLLAVAALATLLPAREALKVDPVASLRYD